MIRRLAVASIAMLALASCASYDSSYRHGYGDGSYRGSYNDGYYAAPENGYGDYYYDRPQVVVDDYFGYGYPYSGFGYGFGYSSGGFGSNWPFSYDPWSYNRWYGYGYPYGWYRPQPHHDYNDHDADDFPGGWSGNRHGGQIQSQTVTAPNERAYGVRISRQVRQAAPNDRERRDPIRQQWGPAVRRYDVGVARLRDGDGMRGERREPARERPRRDDGSQR